jgi:hypothetical protein
MQLLSRLYRKGIPALQCWKDLRANSLALTDIHIDGQTGFSFFLVKRSYYLINIR